MSDQIVPLSSAPSQKMSVTLTVDGAQLTLQLSVRFNEMANYWVMGISDSQSNMLIDSLPLLTGSYPAANILAQYAYLKIGSAYIINVSGTDLDYPDRNTLGADFSLLWGDTPTT